MTPQRIQRTRTKGWRMPPNTVYIGRPSKWGSPFAVFGRNEYLMCDASHRRTILTPWVIFDHEQDIDVYPATAQIAVDYYRRWLAKEFNDGLGYGIVRPCTFTVENIIAELRGKNLACWCALDAPCHGDVLLEIANGEMT